MPMKLITHEEPLMECLVSGHCMNKSHMNLFILKKFCAHL